MVIVVRKDRPNPKIVALAMGALSWIASPWNWRAYCWFCQAAPLSTWWDERLWFFLSFTFYGWTFHYSISFAFYMYFLYFSFSFSSSWGFREAQFIQAKIIPNLWYMSKDKQRRTFCMITRILRRIRYGWIMQRFLSSFHWMHELSARVKQSN